MITIILTCLLVTGDTLNLTPPDGWETVRVVGKAAPSATAPVEIIALPLRPLTPNVPWSFQSPGAGCKVMMDTQTLVCPKAPQDVTAQKTPAPAAQVEVTVRRMVRVGDVLEAPKGCVLRVESGEDTP